MRVRLPIVMGAVAALGFAGTMYATRSFVEPKMEERPVVERRLTCPEGFKLYELMPKSGWTSGGGSLTTTNGVITWNGSTYSTTEDDKGDIWQQGKSPKASEHVCVSKPSKHDENLSYVKKEDGN